MEVTLKQLTYIFNAGYNYNYNRAGNYISKECMEDSNRDMVEDILKCYKKSFDPENPVLPDQPLLDGRFVKNPLVEHLLDEGGLDMNHLAVWGEVNEVHDRYKAQFAQLIGYSYGGWSTLSYVSEDHFDEVSAKTQGPL